MEEGSRRLLHREAGKLGLSLGERELELFSRYLSLLDKWSARMNLTSVKGERDRVVRHFLDSLQAAPLLPPGMRVMDLGSGAGLPGIPVKIARPDLEMTLCESRRKRASFLLEAVRVLGLPGLMVFHGRAEDWPGEAFDAVLARGVGSLEAVQGLAGPLLKPGGLLLAFKGVKKERVSSEAGFELEREVKYRLPGRSRDFAIYVFRKEQGEGG